MQRAYALLCPVAAVLATVATASGHGTKGPVGRVVQLLEDLKARVEQDGTKEQAIYDKYACWCEKTTARKAEAIHGARDELRTLGQDMLKFKGTIETLMAEIEEIKKDIKANEDSQAEATAIRRKENDAYMAEATEMKQALSALEKAIVILRQGSKPSSFLQQRSAATVALMKVLEWLPSAATLKPGQVSLLRELTNTGDSGKYTPQSWTIQGMLGDMYETFSADLESSMQTEAVKNRDFESFIAEKVKQLRASQAEKLRKEDSKAQAEGLLADRTQSYDDTQLQLKADTDFFDETKAACESKHTEWDTRSELRFQELEGISRALNILTADDARELFASAIKPGKETHVDNSYDAGVSIASFLQLSSGGSASAPVTHAFASLRSSATQVHSPRLAALAARVHEAKAGHFDEVLRAIDDMVATLKEESVADAEKRDQCKTEYQKVASAVGKIEWLIQKNEAAIGKLEGLLVSLNKEKASTVEDLADIEEQIKAMPPQRETEHKEFLIAKADDQQAIELLVSARAALSSYYTNASIDLGPIQGDRKGLVLSQQGPEFAISADQAPEASFSDKAKHKNQSKGIIQLLTMIIEDLSDEIKNAMKADELAQFDYVKQLAAAKALREELDSKKVNLEGMIAKRQEEKEVQQGDLTSNQGELKDEQDYKAQITPDCDWILRAFERRAAQRAVEMDGLVQAKEFLAGSSADGPALLDKHHARAVASSSLPSTSPASRNER